VPDRASVTQGIQIGVESTPGTAVPANKLLRSFTVEPGPHVDMQTFRPVGSKFNSVIVPGKEWVEGKITGIGSYQEIQYLLSGIMADVGTNPTLVTGGQVWTHELKQRAPDTIKTYSIEQGDSNFAHKFNYGLITELGLNFSRDGCEIDGSFMARALTTGATLTGSPTTVDPEVVMLPTEIDVYYNTTFGTIGTTKLGRAFQANLKISDRFAPVWVLNSLASSYTAHVETAPTVEVELLVEADTEGIQFFPIMRAGTTGYLRIKATSTQLAAGTAYSFQADLAGKVSDVSDFSDEDGVYAITWTMSAAMDTNTNMPLKTVVRNMATSL
jgi:hypothetical protein